MELITSTAKSGNTTVRSIDEKGTKARLVIFKTAAGTHQIDGLFRARKGYKRRYIGRHTSRKAAIAQARKLASRRVH